MTPDGAMGPSGGDLPGRLKKRAGEVVDRDRSIEFTFDDETYSAHPGDTIASALVAAGIRVFSRSFKYHRPRGLLCCAGNCPNCLVQVGDEPNVRACRRPVEEGMSVAAQNAWPSLRHDLMSLTQYAAPLMPVGFYYKTFMRPKKLWPLYEHVLRQAAGLGTINTHAQELPGADKRYLHADVAVIGGGPAGVGAALAAAREGARVLLFDENTDLGGHGCYRRGGVASSAALRSTIDAVQGGSTTGEIEVLTDTSVFGWYKHNWLGAVQGRRLFKVRAKAVVLATGSFERPPVFGNNDLPGIMLGSGVSRLLHQYSVAPGRRVVVVTVNDEGWELAADLVAAGVEVVAVVDRRPQRSELAEGPMAQSGATLLFSHTIWAASGRGEVEGARFIRVGGSGADGADPSAGGPTLREPTLREPMVREAVACDLIALSTDRSPARELAYMAGAQDDQFGTGPGAGDTLPPGMYAAGRCRGTKGVEEGIGQDIGQDILYGEVAGRAAAAFARDGIDHPDNVVAVEVDRIEAEDAPCEYSPEADSTGSGKSFVCLCEDVTDEDLQTAMAEGFDHIQLLKRYSTATMGPCQGRMCAAETARICARTTGRTLREVGRTTARPPAKPVTLDALAGQKMDPVQITPLHDWHVDRGANMMVAGLWLRPEHYGDAVAEVRAVRQRVGLIDVSPLGKLKLTGPGVPDLLERIYANQWRQLGRGRVRYGVMCNDEGAVIDDGVTARVGDTEWYMSTTSSGARSVFEWIEWWLQSGWGDGVHLTDLTQTYAAFNLAGPRARQVLQKLTGRDLGNGRFPYMRVRTVRVAGVPCRVLRIGFTGELSYELHCPAGYAPHLWEALMEAGEEFDLLPFGVEAQRVLRLEKGHIIVGQDTDALSDPISADLGWAVKMAGKDDFLGRRALTRISQNGPRQRLVGFEAEGADDVPEEGLQIVGAHDRIIGWVTSSRYSSTLGRVIGLCWLPVEIASQSGGTFRIHRAGGDVVARVHHGPFYDPQGERLKL